MAQLHADCNLQLDTGAATDRDPGATFTDGKLKLNDPRVVLDYLIEKHQWHGAWADRIEMRARERAALAAFDAVVVPAFHATVRGLTLPVETRKNVVTELRELAQTAHANGFRVGNALSLWVAPAWMRMRWLREHSPMASMIGEWIELGGWLEAAAALPEVTRTAPSRGEVQAAVTTRVGGAA